MYIADQLNQLIRRCVESTGSCTVVAQSMSGKGPSARSFLVGIIILYEIGQQGNT